MSSGTPKKKCYSTCYSVNTYRAKFDRLSLADVFNEQGLSTWEEFETQYGIVGFKTQMNHWTSWMEVDFKSERHYNMFKIKFSEYL